MQEEIRQQVLSRIERDYGLKHRNGTPYMRGGKCPHCGKKELYTSFQTPWVLRCGRQAKCGQEVRVRDLYDDLFDDYSKSNPQTPQAPHAAADAYLATGRGFNVKPLQGLYTQEDYYDRAKRQGTATVRFPLVKGGWWERLIDRPHRFGKMKARFAPGESYAGVWWGAAALDQLRTAREVWIVEGIFDAIALLQHGICAVAAMSSNAYPELSLKELRDARPNDLPVLVWALDNEPGARGYTAKHIRRAEKLGYRCKAAQIEQTGEKKTDWNDLHLRAQAAEDGDSQWQADIDLALHNGALLLARTAMDKGLIMYEREKNTEFHLEHNSRLYWFEFDALRYEKLCRERAVDRDLASEDELEAEELSKIQRASASIRQIANCYPEALYFQKHDATDESWYFFRVDFPHDAPSVKGTFTGAQIASATEFKKRLLSLAQGALFSGTGKHLDRVMDAQTFGIKDVATVDFVGYSPDHKAYIFGDLAVRNGEVTMANAEDYFEFPKLRIKTTQRSIRMDIQRDHEAYRTEWLQWLWTCFGTNGMVALTFWFGSLFANQIRTAHKSFPFLEATGEAGAGKTTLLTFLWKLLARSDYEGFDPAKSSKAGRARAMGQTSGMPVVLLEADRDAPDKAHAKSFEWDELKDYYGGGTLATRGVRNGGNETYEPPFRGTIVISQNAAVDASEAIMTRIVKLHFRKPNATTESRLAADNLNALQVEDLSHFLIKAVRAEAQVMEKFGERVRFYEAKLRENKDLRMERLIKNHSQMLALLDGLRLIIDIPEDMVTATRKALVAMAMERQSAVSADHPLVNEFWEAYEYLESLGNGERPVVNHSRDPQRIAVNLNDFIAKAAHHSQPVADLKLLRAYLRDSRRYKLVDTNLTVNSAIKTNSTGGGVAVRCWVFKK
ncbi:toprim domain-containing protein [Stenotrophomonas maltophilia]|uniref:toprim domain-containing protein n=1 Tax=Stenotrophomonas TaxID=40323 RepID=UPI000468F9AD|nr:MULTISPECIES: toprim domain-containing protein [Stenotrophomonas]OMP40137.1 bifunctional DNA primase/helicase [Stenotrophomonas sp. KAs 5-3]AIL09269.1 toprim-like family protein [Stenotrophomonas maltophilia]OMO42160.1 bifunctional DNA primase/helicase [Stenotrophomonas sp. MB339]OOD20051.1 bifunctional DNA primase/helicase [Stenotrophomonas maltophilia]QQA82828.1 toprim domain-containing protein [Stenotrophomonas maltophilia]